MGPDGATRRRSVIGRSGRAGRTQRRSDSAGTGVTRAIGTPRLVTVNVSPCSTARMISALSLRSSR